LEQENVRLLKAKNWRSTGEEYTGPIDSKANKVKYSKKKVTTCLNALAYDARRLNDEQAATKFPDDEEDETTSSNSTDSNNKTSKVQRILAEKPELLSKIW